MLSTLLHTLPYAIVNAASPTIPVAAVAVMAIPGRGRRAIAWFLLGSAVVVAVATVLILTVFANVNLSNAARDLLPPWIDVVLGVALLALGIWWWVQGPRPRTGSGTRRSFGTMRPWAIVGVAAYMEAINLVTPPAYLGGVLVASQADLSTAALTGVVLIDALVVLLPVWGLLLISIFAPARTDAFLAAIQRLFHRYGHAALVVLLLGIGAWLIVRSGWALLR